MLPPLFREYLTRAAREKYGGPAGPVLRLPGLGGLDIYLMGNEERSELLEGEHVVDLLRP